MNIYVSLLLINRLPSSDWLFRRLWQASAPILIYSRYSLPDTFNNNLTKPDRFSARRFKWVSFFVKS